MTDQHGRGEQDAAIPASWGARDNVTQSIAEPVLSGEYGAMAPPEAPDAPAASSKLPWFAAVFGAMVLLVGGGFFALTAFGASGGAETPEEAVDALIAAANDEDFITIAELLEPSERRTIAEPVITEVLPELIRLGVLDDSADAGNVEGFEWEFTDVTYRVESIPLNDDMVRVYFTGGEAAAEFNAAEFPFGDDFRERFGDEIQDEPRVTEAIEESETPMVLVERDGRWYMSAMFTIAETARIEAGEQMPDAALAPRSLGSPTPEAAVEAMFAEMMELDMAGFIGRMDPEEMAVLYRYAPTFLDEGQAGLDDFSDFLEETDVQWDLSEFDFDVETDGDDASVVLRGFRLEVTSNEFDVSFTYGRDRITGQVNADDFGRGSLDATPSRWVIEGIIEGETVDIEVNIDSASKSIEASGDVMGTRFTGSVEFDDAGLCSRYAVTVSDGTDESGCIEDGLDSGASFVTQQYVGFLDNFSDEFGGVTIAARQTDGEWYVSPVTSVLDYYIGSLKELDEGEFDAMLDSMSAASLYGFGAVDSLGSFEDDSDFVFDNFEEFDEGDFEEFDSFEEFDEGDFEFDFDEFDEGFATTESTLGTSSFLTVDSGMTLSISGTLESNTFDEALVDLVAGDVVTVTVQADPSSDLDTTVEVFGTTGSIGYNDDADFSAGIGPLDSRVELQIPSDGTYTIEVRSFGDFGSGDYTLSVQRS